MLQLRSQKLADCCMAGMCFYWVVQRVLQYGYMYACAGCNNLKEDVIKWKVASTGHRSAQKDCHSP